MGKPALQDGASSTWETFPTRWQDFAQKLVDRGTLTLDQLEVFNREGHRLLSRNVAASSWDFLDILIDLKLVEPEALLEAIHKIHGFSTFNLPHIILDPKRVEKIPQSIAKAIPCIFVEETESAYYIAVSHPEDLITRDQLERHLGTDKEIVMGYAFKNHILTAIDLYYPTEQDPSFYQEGEAIKLAQSILLEGLSLGASDIHLQPDEYVVKVRFRLDGVLGREHTLHKECWQSLCVRFKILSKTNISESRRPQSGRFSFNYQGRDIDLRLSLHPTLHGENIVIRILDKKKSLMGLPELGFTSEEISLIQSFAIQPQGLIIFSGPTGSGKTTTLYALLSHMNSRQKNIMTLEDPIEYHIQTIRQTEIREGGPLNFADGIRSLLRQDPDVIFVSEIRDSETAQMALRASMTGHLIIATLHAADTVSVPERLHDLGIPLRRLAGNLICSISQRLIRRLCPECKQIRLIHQTEKCLWTYENQESPEHIYQAQENSKGCSNCFNTGYKGRLALAEILPISPELESLIAEGAPRLKLKQSSLIPTLWQKALIKVSEGLTSLDEIYRAVGSPR